MIYAKDAKPVDLKQIENDLKADSRTDDEIDEQLFVEFADNTQNFTWNEFWNLIRPNFIYFLASILVGLDGDHLLESNN